MNKTKKELIRDLDDLMRIIAFYIDEDIIPSSMIRRYYV